MSLTLICLTMKLIRQFKEVYCSEFWPVARVHCDRHDCRGRSLLHHLGMGQPDVSTVYTGQILYSSSLCTLTFLKPIFICPRHQQLRLLFLVEPPAFRSLLFVQFNEAKAATCYEIQRWNHSSARNRSPGNIQGHLAQGNGMGFKR